MPVPDYQTMMRPVLEAFAHGASSVPECVPHLRKTFQMTDEEAQERLPSGTQTYLLNRAHWARSYMAKAGLIESPRRGKHTITEKGRALLATHPGPIDNEVLARESSFVGWLSKSAEQEKGAAEGSCDTPPTKPVVEAPPSVSETPEDLMEKASTLLDSSLSAAVSQKVVLIDGDRLTALMIRHGVGVRVRQTYVVQSVDEDYFAEG